ncbi:TetR/AcrR family transcriptional regulator [Actinomadura harenae]|uniref:TetR/AcrR family transcriptional regulator n=1 Tax=Actinomadura harenae TaxID=2483351 RepID=A0A3M2ME16_9ACTN|nr:TetR family transcriptional regulator [Actinomadura harenae]RMI47696.1 TetR/AcrR family transcriptional regulator [Actinomadura harenae]
MTGPSPAASAASDPADESAPVDEPAPADEPVPADESGAGRRAPGRPAGRTDTREQILTAARTMFAEKGFDGASLRAIAREAGVDPALVHHYFGSKEGVFVAAMRFPVNPAELLPKVMAGPPERMGEHFAREFIEIWEDPDKRAPIVAMLRSAMTNERAAALMREFVTSALLERVAAVRGVPLLRLQAAVGQLVGMMIMRHVIRVEPLASASQDDLVDLVAPTLQRYIGAS